MGVPSSQPPTGTASGRWGRASLDVRALTAATVTVVLWASAFVAIRSAAAHFAPGALALGRLLSGGFVLVLIWLLRREGLPPRAAWPGIALSGVLWFGVYMVALNWGEQRVDAGTAAMVVNVGPILIALLGGWLLGEGLPGRLMVGMAIAFAGAALVGVSLSTGGAASAVGVLLCLLAAAAYAAGVVGQKVALRYASALQVTASGCVVGLVACLPFSGQLWRQLTAAPTGAVLDMLYLGVFPTAVAFTTWAYALSRTTAGRMGATTYAVPALVVVMSGLLLREVPDGLSFVGGGLCLLGVAVSRGRSVRPAPPSEPTSAPTVERGRSAGGDRLP